MRKVTPETLLEVDRLAALGMKKREIAERLGIHYHTVNAIANGRHPLQIGKRSRGEICGEALAAIVAIVGSRQQGRKSVGMTPAFIPTPEQIERCCRAIRATWSDAERDERRYAVPDAA